MTKGRIIVVDDHELFRAGLIPYWRGISPDGLHDMFKWWKGFEIVMESKQC